MALTRVSPALFQVSNNITSVTVGGSANTISLTFDSNGVITGASNNALLISNTAITGNIISSQITSVANTQLTGLIQAAQIGSANATLVTSGTLPGARLPAGSVLQVVQATYSTPVTISSTSNVDTGLSASITPTSATSKILVLTSQAGFSVIDSNASRTNIISLVRGSTTIFTFYWETNGAVGANGFKVDPYSANIEFLDSPATTSSVTYKTQARGDTTSNSLQTRWQNGNNPSSMILLEIAA
jgi:hypothetical protein